LPGPSSTADPTDADAPTPESVLADLEAILLDVIGEDFLLDEPLTMETSFDADLQLESIEFVALAEKLLERYGEQVDFVNWLAGMDLDQIIALTVGQLVDFVVAAA
jgi:acyl carrier protein